MPLQYVQNNAGETTAVIIPIEEWKRIKNKYPEIAEAESAELPQWQKELIDSRLNAISNSPERLKPVDGLLNELDKED